MMLSIVIPAYNEEPRLKKNIEKVISYLNTKPWSSEIIVVDDGSTDKTSEVISEFKNSQIRFLKNEGNRGKGYSIKRGVLEARGDLILCTDADLSTPVEELDKFLEYRDYDILIGSRALKNSKIIIPQPLYREYAGKFFNLLVQITVMHGIKDTQCGFKLFKKPAAQKIFKQQTIRGFGFDVEILYIGKKLGYKIKEIPVNWSNNRDTKVKFLKHSFEMLIDLFRIRLNEFLGIYK